MANKFTDWVLTILLWLFILAVFVGVVYLILQPVVVWTEKSELRLYVRIALILLAVGVFGILRLYNSVVQNTRFLVKLHTGISKVLAELPNVQRSLNMLGSKTDSLRGTVANNSKAVNTLSEEARELLSILKQRSNGASKNPH